MKMAKFGEPCIGGIYLEVVSKDRKGNRMGCGLWIDSGAKHLKPVSACLAEQILGENAACGISGA